MTYNPLIPGPNDVLSQSQSDIQDNFAQLNNLYDLDHFAFDDTTISYRGLHRYISFPFSQPTNPSLGSLAAILFPRTKTGNTELYFKNGVDYTQITSAALPIWKGGTPTDTGVVGGTIFNSGPVSNGHGNTVNYGNIILPTGLELKWGWMQPTAGNIDDLFFQFPTAFSTKLIQVFIQGVKDSVNVHSIYIKDPSTGGNYDKTGFRLKSDTTWGTGFFFFAIGY